MGKASRDKGQRRERQVVALHKAMGVHAEKVPLFGAACYQDNGADVDVYALGPDAAPMVSEVKASTGGRKLIVPLFRTGRRPSGFYGQATANVKRRGSFSSLLTSDRSCGYMARHGGHQSPQKSSTTTWPR